MAKTLIILFIVLAGFIAGPLLAGQTGYVLIIAGGYEIESSLVVFLLCVLVFILCLWLVEWAIRKVASGGKFTQRWATKRKEHKAHSLLTESLNDLLSANFHQAQNKAESSAQYAKDKEPAYLIAALSADFVNDASAKQSLLQKAAAEKEGKSLPLQLNQAQSAAPDASLNIFNRLLTEYPKHPGVQCIAAETFYKQKQWIPLQKLLPALEKESLISDKRLTQYQARVYECYFNTAGSSEELHEKWKSLPNKTHQQPGVRIAYAGALQATGAMAESDKILVKGLRKSSLSLIHLLQSSSTLSWQNHNLLNEYVQQYLKNSANDVDALVLLGAIALHQGNYELAQRALQSAIQIRPAADYYCLLGDAYLALGQHEPALSAYQKAAKTE